VNTAVGLAGAGVGGVIVLGWVLTARALFGHAKVIGELRERVAFLEARVNGQGGKRAETA
jgi:hypothetical protein